MPSLANPKGSNVYRKSIFPQTYDSFGVEYRSKRFFFYKYAIPLGLAWKKSYKLCALVSLFVLAICFGGCVETVSLRDLGVKPKLVLYCFLSPQYDTISVSLTNSQPLFSPIRDVSEVRYAMVEISNDNQHWTQIPYNEETKRYLLAQSQFPIIEGKTYYIRASAPDYESISAFCTVPFWRETNFKPEVEFFPKSKDNLYSYLSLYFSWEDYFGEENYYAFIGYELYEYVDVIHLPNYGFLFDTSIRINAYTLWDNYDVVFSNEGKDGEKMNVVWRELSDYTLSEFMEQENVYNGYTYDSVHILFVQTEKNTFLYENSFSAARDTEFTSIFTIEPTLVYSNIKNGYGVFGALTFKPYLLNFRKKTAVEVEVIGK